ncbi:hypothetical protein [Streptomyces sp. NPDC051014]|uniref:hypothetical protein n=1 Tax=Streptomyces sp. NPDC051014 TaxID=3155751 RepID=UPI0033DC224D
MPYPAHDPAPGLRGITLPALPVREMSNYVDKRHRRVHVNLMSAIEEALHSQDDITVADFFDRILMSIGMDAYTAQHLVRQSDAVREMLLAIWINPDEPEQIYACVAHALPDIWHELGFISRDPGTLAPGLRMSPLPEVSVLRRSDCVNHLQYEAHVNLVRSVEAALHSEQDFMLTEFWDQILTGIGLNPGTAKDLMVKRGPVRSMLFAAWKAAEVSKPIADALPEIWKALGISGEPDPQASGSGNSNSTRVSAPESVSETLANKLPCSSCGHLLDPDGDRIQARCSHVFHTGCMQQLRDEGGTICPQCAQPLDQPAPHTRSREIHELAPGLRGFILPNLVIRRRDYANDAQFAVHETLTQAVEQALRSEEDISVDEFTDRILTGINLDAVTARYLVQTSESVRSMRTAAWSTPRDALAISQRIADALPDIWKALGIDVYAHVPPSDVVGYGHLEIQEIHQHNFVHYQALKHGQVEMLRFNVYGTAHNDPVLIFNGFDDVFRRVRVPDYSGTISMGQRGGGLRGAVSRLGRSIHGELVITPGDKAAEVTALLRKQKISKKNSSGVE